MKAANFVFNFRDDYALEAKVINLSDVGNSTRRMGLILVGRQQNQGTSPDGFDSVLLCQFFQLRIFGAGIKNKALGPGVDDIIVILRLYLWADVQRNTMDIRQRIT